MLRRRRISLGVVVLAVAAAVPTLVALNPLASSGAVSGRAPTAPSGQAAFAQQLTRALAVLRRSATSNDVLPARLSHALEALHVSFDPALARRALVTHTGTDVYLVPSATGVCLVDGNLSEASCFSTSAVLSSGATASVDCSPTLPNGNTIEIAGVIPDGASNPVVVLADGTKRPLAVEGNAYLEQFRRSDPLPSQIEWEAATGPVAVSARVPTDVATEHCVASAGELRALEASGKIPPALGHPPAEPTQTVEYNRG